MERMDAIDAHDYTILVVDDSLNNLKIVTKYLSHVGFTVLTAQDGVSCLQSVETNRPHLILLDVMMPGLDGFETCRRLKAAEETRDIPIIFMTALADTQDKIKGFEVGAVDYVIKPIDHEELLSRVITHLRNYALTHQLEQLVEARTQALERALQREQHLAVALQRALERETELSQLRSQIIEVISHEFRTPLTVILQSASLLEQFIDKLSVEQRIDKFQKIKESIFFIDKLLQDVSQVNAINTAKMHVRAMPMSWHAFCTHLSHAISKQGQARERLAVAFEPADSELTTDLDVVEEIVVQLVSNALKFSADVVSVRGHLHEHAAVMTVSDRGIGIPTADQPKVFDLFYRASNVEARRGLGLGLYIANQLTDALGGRLSVESNGVDQGTCATLIIPPYV